ncbi:peptidase S8/S53 domain-containing protein [Aspergillus arachidicola]|uniref:Peptidase S8/S53 domain-containing protein n=1 Tax=Aspergillus arachidicola TaxID=656916 RepID=A0A5N6YAG4_9EURO|nr:peptidase S8/S53 domain-containing protein [Aspergillus arachidicola]
MTIYTHVEGEAVSLSLAADRNPWLDNMDRFVSFVQKIPRAGREVKVAVIDDGVDKVLEDFGNSIIAGVSFYSHQIGDFTGVKPWYFSSNGHSTLMAKTIRRLCPNVKLCIARLEQGINGEPTVESAIKASIREAISWATTIEVYIISMSWTFSELHNSEARKLSEVIDEAHRSRVITLSALSDQGLNRPEIAFPGKVPGVFRIGAARSNGKADEFSVGYDFIFPGGSSKVEAPKGTGRYDDPNPEMVMGSSFATAVASGLAALILHCVELCDLGDEYGNGDWESSEHRQRHNCS